MDSSDAERLNEWLVVRIISMSDHGAGAAQLIGQARSFDHARAAALILNNSADGFTGKYWACFGGMNSTPIPEIDDVLRERGLEVPEDD
jgi:hypothetical protein